MVKPVSSSPGPAVGPLRPTETPRPGAAPSGAGSDFAGEVRRQLEQVSRMQAEADAGIHQLLTGQSNDLTGVFATARKAEVAFSLLMEIRNKLIDAYVELRQLRV